MKGPILLFLLFLALEVDASWEENRDRWARRLGGSGLDQAEVSLGINDCREVPGAEEEEEILGRRFGGGGGGGRRSRGGGFAGRKRRRSLFNPGLLQGLPGSGDTLYFVLEESEGEDGRVKGNCTVAIKEADPEEETGLVGEYGSPVEDVCEDLVPGAPVRFCQPNPRVMRGLVRDKMRSLFEQRRRAMEMEMEENDFEEGEGEEPPRYPFDPELEEEDLRSIEIVAENFEGKCYRCPDRDF